MKKTMLITLAVLFVVSFTVPLYALPDPIHDPIYKFKDGAIDVLRAPYDGGLKVRDEIKSSDFKPFGLVGGLIKGTGHMVKQAVSGAVDMATFLVK